MAIAVAEALDRSLAAKTDRGLVGRLLGSGPGLSDLVLGAASQSHLALGGLARDRGDLATAVHEYTAALESAQRMRKAKLATGVAMLELGHTTQLQGRQQEAEGWLRKAHPLLLQLISRFFSFTLHRLALGLFAKLPPFQVTPNHCRDAHRQRDAEQLSPAQLQRSQRACR